MRTPITALAFSRCSSATTLGSPSNPKDSTPGRSTICGPPRSQNAGSRIAPSAPACASRSVTRRSRSSRPRLMCASTSLRSCCAWNAARSQRSSRATSSRTRSARCSIILSVSVRASTYRRITVQRRRSRPRCAPPPARRLPSSPSALGTGMVIPLLRRSPRSRECRRIAPIKMAPWRSHSMAQGSSSAPTRMLYLLHGEDSFRIRLRANELIGALIAGETPPRGDLSTRELRPTSTALGLVRIDARTADPDEIVMAGQSQGLFAAPDERRVVLVEHAESLARGDVVERFPDDAALVLVAPEAMKQTRSRGARKATKSTSPADLGLMDVVENAGGSVERYDRLFPNDVARWISARAQLFALN